MVLRWRVVTCGEKVKWSREKRERQPADVVGLKFGTLHPPTKAEEDDTRLAAVRLPGMTVTRDEFICYYYSIWIRGTSISSLARLLQ